MKAAYNQNNVELYHLNEVYADPCENCIFLRSEKSTCIVVDFGKDNFDELPGCWDGIFIPKPLSNIFKL
jgi:hypothetical protein